MDIYIEEPFAKVKNLSTSKLCLISIFIIIIPLAIVLPNINSYSKKCTNNIVIASKMKPIRL